MWVTSPTLPSPPLHEAPPLDTPSLVHWVGRIWRCREWGPGGPPPTAQFEAAAWLQSSLPIWQYSLAHLGDPCPRNWSVVVMEMHSWRLWTLDKVLLTLDKISAKGNQMGTFSAIFYLAHTRNIKWLCKIIPFTAHPSYHKDVAQNISWAPFRYR